MKSFSCEEPIAALASPWGVSAIGVIRTSGEGTLAILSRIFRGPRTQADLSHGRGSRLYHGYLWDGERKIDEIILAVYRKPRSYTGEDSAEIYCHGGLAIIQQILELLLRSGFQQAAPGEFTLRAFLNDKMDLTRAEAVNEIIRAKTDRARALALNRLSGAVERKVQQIKEALIELSAAVEVQIDYPDEDLEENLIDRTRVNALILEIEKLLSTYRTGKIIQEGTSVVIAGRTNAGKSTLFNLLL
ncbi:MAG TPA: tRNA uridine-5-carboxymethylaminomethyl(34) synthesis GTPase MnmE, partial [Spirochaetia bacterium]|nr:tRNA uridine-5-carboxymethylaminomethyl(34) synthesis GTPase MnmE [Spirochaetia bacterium]